MKKFIFLLLIMFISTLAFAGTKKVLAITAAGDGLDLDTGETSYPDEPSSWIPFGDIEDSSGDDMFVLLRYATTVDTASFTVDIVGVYPGFTATVETLLGGSGIFTVLADSGAVTTATFAVPDSVIWFTSATTSTATQPSPYITAQLRSPIGAANAVNVDVILFYNSKRD